MSKRLESALDSIEAGLVRLGLGRTLDLLATGVNSRAFWAGLEGISPSNLRSLIEVYSWHDGTVDTVGLYIGECYIFPGFYMLSTSEVAVTYRQLLQAGLWDPNLVPFMADGGGDFIVIDSVGCSEGSVRHFRNGETDAPVEYSNVESMFLTFAEAYDQGAFVVDSDGFLDLDLAMYSIIANRLNPGVAWWGQG